MSWSLNPFTGNLDLAGAGSATSPGGLDTQLQFNDSGSFGGASGLLWDETAGTLTISGAPLALSGNISAASWGLNGLKLKGGGSTLTDTSAAGTVATGATNVLGGNTIAATNARTITDYYTTYINTATAGTNVTLTNKWALGLAGAAQVAAGTFTAAQPALDITQTWNNAGVTFTGLKFSVTDTASSASSLLMDLQIGGASRLKLSKSGQFATAGGTASGAVAVAFGPGTASGASSIIVGNGTASGNYSGVFGFSSTASAYNGFVFGDYITADKIGQYSISGCAGKSAAWNTQTSTLHLLAETTDATVTEAFLTGLANARATLPNNATWEVRALIVAKTSAGAKTMAWEWFGVIHKAATAASTAVLGTPTLTLIADPNTAGWSVEFSADTTNGALKLAVTGGASDSIRWAATLHIIQIVFG